MDDVHSEGPIDGNGGVVGCRVEDGRTTWQVIQSRKIVLWSPCWKGGFIGGVHVEEFNGHHVDSDQSCWSRCSSNSGKKKMLFLIVNTSSTLISLSTMMAVWTEVMLFTRKGSKDGGYDEGGCHGVNGRHVVNGVGDGGVWGDSMKNRILMLLLSY